MDGLLRLQMRDGRWLSGGSQGVPGGDVHAVSGDPTHLETFAVVAPAVLPLIDGGPVALAVCDQNFQPTPQLMNIDSHLERDPQTHTDDIVFGGPGTTVYCASSGPVPPSDQDPQSSHNLFQAALDAQGELSIQVADRNIWYFRVDDNGVVNADGTAPFGDRTAFRIVFGPFNCASVSGQVIDATNNMRPLPGAQLTTNAGFSATADAAGGFSLASPGPGASTCVPAGPLVITTTEPRHVTTTTSLTVPGSGAITEQIALTCRLITGSVTDEAGKPLSTYPSNVFLTFADGSVQQAPPDPNTGAFIFLCVLQGHYTLSYPGATPLAVDVPDAGLSGLHLVVASAQVRGHVTDAVTGQPLVGASVSATRPPSGVATSGLPDRGAYLLSGLQSGPQIVTAADPPSYGSATFNTNLSAGQNVIHDFQLPPITTAVQGVFNTGVGPTALVLGAGSPDPHWQIIAGPGIGGPQAPLVVQDQSPFGLYFQASDSAWIWVRADGTGAVGAPYTFQLQFTLTAVSATTRLSGGWGCDNHGLIQLNGSQTPTGTGILSLPGGAISNFQNVHFFTLAAPFVVGVNKLDILVTDDGNPGGLNVTKLILTP
jgi:Carboxypeptidase regulatory-like domain